MMVEDYALNQRLGQDTKQILSHGKLSLFKTKNKESTIKTDDFPVSPSS